MRIIQQFVVGSLRSDELWYGSEFSELPRMPELLSEVLVQDAFTRWMSFNSSSSLYFSSSKS